MRKTNPALLSLLFLLTACQGTESEKPTEAQEELSLLEIYEDGNETILDDNYRNYYEIFVYSYADSNGDKIGDLNGITEKLDCIKESGYTGIWLTPIFKSTTYHKYDAVDYFQIDPTFGTMEDLKALVKKAHSLDIKVILDGVFNHTSLYNSWYESAVLAHNKYLKGQTLSEEEKKFNTLYKFYDSEEEARASGHKYYQAGANPYYYEGNFDRAMPEFNFDSEFTYELIQRVIDFYMAPEIGIDGFRLDAVKYYYLGENDKNVQVLTRIEEMMRENNPNAYGVGECWDSNTTIEKYYQSELDSFFYFPAAGSDGYIAISVNNKEKLKGNYYRGSKDLEAKCQNGIPAPFLNNHDMARLSYSTLPDLQKFVFALLGMSKGTTFHYYGDDIGMVSTNLPSGDYKDSSYRTHYYWDDDTHESECQNVPNAVNQPQIMPCYKTQREDPSSMLSYITAINKLRNIYPFIARGTLVDGNEAEESANNSSKQKILTLTKRYEEKDYKVMINFSDTDEASCDITGYKPLAGLKIQCDDTIKFESNTLTLSPHSIALLKTE